MPHPQGTPFPCIHHVWVRKGIQRLLFNTRMFAGKPEPLHGPASGPIRDQSGVNAGPKLATPRIRTVRKRPGLQRPRSAVQPSFHAMPQNGVTGCRRLDALRNLRPPKPGRTTTQQRFSRQRPKCPADTSDGHFLHRMSRSPPCAHPDCTEDANRTAVCRRSRAQPQIVRGHGAYRSRHDRGTDPADVPHPADTYRSEFTRCSAGRCNAR